MSGSTLLNLFKGYVIKTPQHFHLHFIKGLCMASDVELELHCTPVSLNEV